MRQRGRKSELKMMPLTTIVGEQPRLQPPPHLTKRQRTEFTEIVNAASANHFVKSDVPLIASLARVNLLVRDTKGDFATYEKAVRLQVLLSRSLRLTVQSRSDPKTVSRHAPIQYPRPWEDWDQETQDSNEPARRTS
jgi:hypothetical protein